MEKIRLGILGGGGDSLIGVLHRIASSMFDKYQIVGGVFNPNWEENIGFAKKIGIPTDRIYLDFDKMLAAELQRPPQERMEVVSVLTPNFLHYPMALKLIQSNFNVICEKPMTTSLDEANSLLKEWKKNKPIFAVTYTYTGYPMVRQMKEMVANGLLGKLQKVDVQYYQGWINPIIHDKEKRANTWRLNPEKSGISCCMGDIGTHAFNMAEYTTGMQIKEILADLNYLYEDNYMDIDGTVLVHFTDGTNGIIRTSQIATGEENNLTIAIYGTKGGLKWEQENPNYLTFLKNEGAMEVFKRGNPYNANISLESTKIPPGHPEGIFDAMGNIYHGVSKALRRNSYHPGEFPTIQDGLRGMNFIEQAVYSHKNGNLWTQL